MASPEWVVSLCPESIYAKSGLVNLTGSIKDRGALHILRRAYREGTIQPGYGILEAISGNAGIAISAIGRALGHPVTVFMPDWMSEERRNLYLKFGATIAPVSQEESGFLGRKAKAEELAKREGSVFMPHRFSNMANCEVHEQSTGPEIWYQLKARELKPDAFVAGVGTGGTVMGVGRFLRSKNPAIRVHPVEPKESPTLGAGCKVRKHRIHGISNEFIPDMLDMGSLGSVIQLSDGDSISPEVELLKYHTFRRSCRTCSDLDECQRWDGSLFGGMQASTSGGPSAPTEMTSLSQDIPIQRSVIN